MSTETTALDFLDNRIITILQEDASLTNNELAKRIELSPSATHERVRKLHSNGTIKKISAFIAASALDKTLCAFIYVLIEGQIDSNRFLNEIASNREIMECHHITGEYSYLLKVRVKDTHQLESFITQSLKTRYCATKTLTQIALSSPKDGDTIIV